MPRKIKYPCGVCDRSCGNQCIDCSRCEKWVHCKCVPMDESALSSWHHDHLEFICPTCLGGAYDAAAAIERYGDGKFETGSATAIWSSTHRGPIETIRRSSIRVYSNHLPPEREEISNLTDAEFEDVCEATLDSLTERLEDMADQGFMGTEYDVSFSGGVITLRLGGDLGTYVINKQSPNKQIWLSSPSSGPKRYDFKDGVWIYKHDGVRLHALLSTELSKVFNLDIDLKDCVCGSSDR